MSSQTLAAMRGTKEALERTSYLVWGIGMNIYLFILSEMIVVARFSLMRIGKHVKTSRSKEIATQE
jgi:hypothetical protein